MKRAARDASFVIDEGSRFLFKDLLALIRNDFRR